jgi:hypothetical protein
MVKPEPLRLRRGLAVREIPGGSGQVYFARASIDVAVDRDCYEEGRVGWQALVLSDPRYRREDFERVDWVVRDPRPWPERRRDW